jgi:prevent-host-death family protein
VFVKKVAITDFKLRANDFLFSKDDEPVLILWRGQPVAVLAPVTDYGIDPNAVYPIRDVSGAGNH